MRLTPKSARHDIQAIVDVSVVICTRNRAESLRRTLQSLTQLEVDSKTQWEVIVVDNGSTDATADVVKSFSGSLQIRWVFEAVAGLSVARNVGVRAARGRYIIWTDDDVLVHPGWLASYVHAFDRWPDIAIFGGTAKPVLEQPEVPWFKAKSHLLSDLLAERDYGPEATEMSFQTGHVPFGLNYAVRVDVQKRFSYDPDLGVAPGRRRNGEEVEFFQRALAAGARGMCLPEPLVYHLIPLSRQTSEYVRSYYESAGETWLLLRVAENRPLSRRARIWGKFVVARCAYLLARWSGSSLRYDFLIRDAFHTGVFQQLRNAR